MGLGRDDWLALLLASVNVSLYFYLVSHLSWSGTLPLVVSSLFLVTSTFYVIWNLGYSYAFHRRSRHQKGQPASIRPESLPSISLIVPAYHESLGTLTAMVEGFLQLDYPTDRLRMFLCDDTDDPTHRALAKQLCMELGRGRVEYCTRDHRRGFKAGAINDILPQVTSQYCIMLDADHVPEVEMVRRLVEAKIGSQADFLMFPQYFRNERENTVAATSSLKQLVDYRIMRIGQCVTNSTFCVTTNWIGETETLRRLGGLDESTVTEDFATGMIAHSKGLRIDILDEKLAFGLAPNSLESWRRQQFRWSSGTFVVAKTIFWRVWRRLTWHQRLDYSLCISWYLSGVFSFVLYLFPIFAAFGVKFFHYNSVTEFLAFTLSLIGIGWVLTYSAYSESKSLKKILMAHAVSLGVSDVYVKAFISALTGKKQAFSVTQKGEAGSLRSGTAVRALKYHLFFLAVGAITSIYSMTLERSPDAIANVGWIWHNNLWVIVSALLLGRNRGG